MWAFYGSLNSKINKIIETLISSQNLCKLLYYNDDNPLSQSDIPDTSSLIFKNNYTSENKIFPLPKYVDAEEEKGSLLYIYFNYMDSYKKNTGFKKLNLYIQIACHLNVWYIDSAIRPLSIIHEIDRLLNNQHIDDLSMNKIFSDSCGMIRFSDYFYGYNLEYKLSDNSNINCS